MVIVPGIMGSALYDTGRGTHVWGLGGISWLVRAWTLPGGLKPLAMTEEELAGKTGRIKATGLLEHSAWTPYLAGIEPYADLVVAVGGCVADPAAVLKFAYDWRLPVAVNGRLLAAAARDHLTAWRRHPAHDRARRHRVDEREGRLVFVAHSMGGLVARSALDPALDSDLAGDTRGVITLGTPFLGAVKAAVILNSGRGTPVRLPHRRLRAVCANMPGLHDLLPQYKSVREEGRGGRGGHGDQVRHLTPGDVTAIGGNAELARKSALFHRDLGRVALPGHRTVVGVNQPTLQSLTIRDGKVLAHLGGARMNSDRSIVRDRATGRILWFEVGGDGTVYKESASLGPVTTTLPLQHGAVAKATSALDAVVEIVRDDIHLGPPMGDVGCGLEVPDLVEAGVPWTVRLSDVDTLSGLVCGIANVEDPADEQRLTVAWEDGAAVAGATTKSTGLYRVTVRTPDGHELSQLVMSAEPGMALEESED
ncbi:hypothetical protein [Streptomyces sp. NPDC089799]|uniref:lipase/acyltransferase domain-containing protein n=1 Tax=Streptomyces sp. NPDC089799 TaxID=3155066 RepID=UPI0034312C6A